MEDRTYIISKVTELFRKYGIKSVTMDDVSRELGISKKTLYQHVADKNDLVDKVMEHEWEEKSGIFDNLMSQSENAIDQLIKINSYVRLQLKYFSFSLDYDLRKYYSKIWEDFNSKRRKVMYDVVLNNIKRGKQEGIYREDLNEEFISKLYVSRVESIHEGDMISIEDFLSSEVYVEAFVYHIRGIANSRGIEYLEKNLHKLSREVTETGEDGVPDIVPIEPDNPTENQTNNAKK